MKVRILFALAALSAAVAPSQLLAAPRGLYLGADLSYVNEMEDCGAVYRLKGKPIDPFVLLKKEGGNLVRVRIWVDPTWTKYSNYADVLKTIRRAHAAGLQALLDFHYSDDWADGGKQLTPVAWAKLSTDGQVKALHDYTLDTLRKLDADKAMPEMVQVGNETNPELLGGKVPGPPINWERNARLLNAGIEAVQEAGRASSIAPRIMLHIAQPEYLLPWFDAATRAGVKSERMTNVSSTTPTTIARANSRNTRTGTSASRPKLAASVRPALRMAREALGAATASASSSGRTEASCQTRPVRNTL